MPAYKDYYKILEVPRTASEADIKKAFRRLARKHHPDVSKAAGAEARFKEITEANEVLSDTEKRKRYDELGANWQAGQDFRPPPGWQNAQYGSRGAPRDAGFDTRGMGDFSDFFESIFGGQFGGAGRSAGGRFQENEYAGQERGEDHEAPITISLEEAYHGVKKSISLQQTTPDERGRMQRQTRTYQVRIPAGTSDGARIRLAGQGGAGSGGGPAGDLYLLVHLAPHPLYKVDGRDIEAEVAVTPWEAALGARITIPTLDGHAAIQIPAGTESGHRMRLRGKGMPGTTPGDLLVVIRLVVPKRLSPREKELLEEWAKVSTFKPRE